jgi:hypothetical protein
MMAAGLRATAKAVEHPPEPKIGAPVLDPTDVNRATASGDPMRNCLLRRVSLCFGSTGKLSQDLPFVRQIYRSPGYPKGGVDDVAGRGKDERAKALALGTQAKAVRGIALIGTAHDAREPPYLFGQLIPAVFTT